MFDRVVVEAVSTRKRVSDLPPGIGVKISKSGDIVTIAYWYTGDPEIRYAIRGKKKKHIRAGEADWPHEYNFPYGSVKIFAANSRTGPCDGAFVVKVSRAGKGWGPLLYDIAMEYATKHGGGLTADRGDVSNDAHKIWRYYRDKRPDVKVFQLDDPKNTLTPTPKDNCKQIGRGIYTGIGAVTKRYTKPDGKVTKALKAAGKLVTK